MSFVIHKLNPSHHKQATDFKANKIHSNELPDQQKVSPIDCLFSLSHSE